MTTSYKKLLKLLIDRNMEKKELAKKRISASPPLPRWEKMTLLSQTICFCG